VPPTLILTGEYDTLGPEMDQLVADLAEAGVQVTHHMFAKTDHGFMRETSVETLREAIEFVKAHLLANLA
jgi:acetyl esterase